jgi:ATP-dependent helicase HrpA
MKSLRLGDVEQFPFIEPPLGRAIADGYQLLQELGAVDDNKQLTDLGRQLAKLPLDPRIGRMILAGQEQHCLREVLIIASALSVQDARDRPQEAQGAADSAHKKFEDEKSEFLTYLKLWHWFEEAVAHKKSNRQLQEHCRANFVSQLRLREWRDVHAQLLTLVREQGWHINESPATYEQLHLALLTGLLGNIGFKQDDEPHYLGARGIKFHLWPGSSLSKKAGRWIVAAELVETSRLFARTLAQIHPQWLERVGAHLLKKSWGDPRWEKRSGQVSAYERATLYGLVVYSQRRIDYGKINPEEAREIFIRSALVDGDFDTRAPFLAHNQRLIREIENLEHKSRRQDVLVDDTLIEAFYDKLVPHDVCTTVGFEQWLTKASANHPKLLHLSRDDLMRHEAAGITTDLFPKLMRHAGLDMALTYHFEPGSVRDGVTLAVPLYALNQVSAVRCEWLVPGMLKEKVHLLLKSLPQKLRRHCVPLPDYAAGFCDRIHEAKKFAQGSLLDALIADVRVQTTVAICLADFKLETLPAHHFMNFKLVDEHGRQLDMGRNLAGLQVAYGTQARQEFQKIVEQMNPVAEPELDLSRQTSATTSDAKSVGVSVASSSESGSLKPVSASSADTRKSSSVQSGGKFVNTSSGAASAYQDLTTWSFGELPELLEIPQGRQKLIGFPALVDKGGYCDIEVFDDPTEAASTHLKGLRRLFAIQLKEQLKYLEKNIPGLQQMGMQFVGLGTQEELRDQIIQAGLTRACLQAPLPLNQGEFNKRRDEGKSRLNLLANEIARLVGQILAEHHGLPKKLQGIKTHTATHADISAQLQMLVHKRFVSDTEHTQLAHFPRYLKAVQVRIDKLRTDPSRDARLLADWQQAAAPWQRAVKAGQRDTKLDEYRWLLEELRVSLFAQELRTPMPVSVKRLQKVWEAMQR